MILSFATLIIIVIILGLIIAFLYVKDKEMSQTIVYLQDAIEELNRATSTPKATQLIEDSKAYKELDAKIYEVGESLIKIVRSIKNLDKKVEDLEFKINKIEEGFKLSLLSSSTNSNDLDIIAMYKEGKTAEEIAKEKRVPIGEVELIIKLANLNDSEN